MDTVEQRLHALEVATGLHQEVVPQIGMCYTYTGEKYWTTILGTWATPGNGERYWVVQSGNRLPYLFTDALLREHFQDPKLVTK